MWDKHPFLDRFKGYRRRFMAKTIRVLYSFPHKLGAGRICYTAWQQVNTLAAAGADVLAYPGVLHRPLDPRVTVQPTLARGRLRVSYKVLGIMRALAWHDQIVARRLQTLKDKIDIVHTWPDAALQTLQVARKMGIPTVLERPNAHTRYAYEAVKNECDRIGLELPPDDEYAYKHKMHILEKEEKEYQLTDYLLCPSDFVVKTFLDQGFDREKLVRHQYGYDPKTYFAGEKPPDAKNGLTVLFAGVCAVRKGLHFALEAWLNSPAHNDGTFLIAGEFLPAYAEKLRGMLAHPSVKVLGHRNDVPELMRKSDIFVLPSVEEGSALVTSDARASGCVLLVSEATGAVAKHMENALVHPVGDTRLLTEHFTLLYNDRALLSRLRASSLRTVNEITWEAAGKRLLDVYREIVEVRAGQALVAS
jgi:glycosyltransferase involved in cell wall biosynthesis